MSAMRSTAGVAVLGGRLYVVGGRDGSVCHRSVECYDPHTNKWTLRAPMNKRRGGVGVSIPQKVSLVCTQYQDITWQEIITIRNNSAFIGNCGKRISIRIRWSRLSCKQSICLSNRHS